MLVASFLHGGAPWLVAWGLSSLIDAVTTPAQAASEAEASRLMRFRAAQLDAGRFGPALRKAAAVGVLGSWRHNNEVAQVRAPSMSLRALGVPYRMVTERTVKAQGVLAADAATPLSLLLCDGMATMGAGTADAIAAWVRRGGQLIARLNGCAVVDEAGRRYPRPLLEAALGPGTNGTGRGSALFVAGDLAQNATAVAAMRAAPTAVVSPRTPGHPKTTSWEFVPWLAATSRLVVHFSNATEAGGASEYAALGLQLALPPALAAATHELHATLYTPYEPASRRVGLTRHGGALVVVDVPTPPWYGVLEIS